MCVNTYCFLKSAGRGITRMKRKSIPQIRLLIFGIAWILFAIVLEILHLTILQIVIYSGPSGMPIAPNSPPIDQAIYDTTGLLGVTIHYLWLLRGLIYGIGVLIVLYWFYVAMWNINAC
jgi:hypothetical protein